MPWCASNAIVLMAMSYYPNKTNIYGAIFNQSSSTTVFYSKYTFDYPHLLPFQLILIVWEWSIQWFHLMDIDQKKIGHILKEPKEDQLE